MPETTDPNELRVAGIKSRIDGEKYVRLGEIQWLLDERARFKAKAADAREIIRRILVLAEYGFDMQFFKNHTYEHDFMSVEWIEGYYSEPLPDYVLRELEGSDAQ